MMRRLALLLAAALLGGCAALQPPPSPEPGQVPVSPLRVTVEAPDPLDELLQRHLDLARLSTFTGSERVEEAELARLLAAAPAQARELLQTEGYFDARVEASRDGDAVTVRVRPGERVRIGRLDIELQGELQERAERADATAQALVAQLRRSWPLPPGTPFRNPAWADAKAALLARLRAGGYAAAAWIGTAAEVDPATRQVRLFLVVDSGPLFLSGPLVVEGLEHHDERTVRNLAGFGAGTPLTEALLLDFQDRLRESGLFDAIAVTFEPETALAGATPVRVRLRESPRQVWTLGIGFSDDSGPRASVEHLHRRLFGLPLVSRNKAEWGRTRQAWDGEISTHPLQRQYRWLVGGTVERQEGEDDLVLAQKLRVGRAQATPRIDRFVFAEAERSSRRNLVLGTESTELAVSGNFHGVWRRLDSPLLPTEGWSLSLQGGVGRAHGTDSASGWFGRAYGRLTGYLPLPGGWFGQARLELGQVLRPDGVAVPDSQQFRAGGEDSVRGYAYRSLGPVVDGAVDSGDALATVSVELARPILRSLPSVWGAVFVDAGRAAASFRDFDAAVGAGLGLRWRSPVGPLKVDLAWGEELRSWRLHFSVGVTF